MDEVKLAETLSDHKHRIGSLEHRMDRAEGVIDAVHEITASVQLLAQESKNTGEKIDNLTEKVEDLEKKPGKEWSTVKTAVISGGITCVVTALIGALISML